MTLLRTDDVPALAAPSTPASSKRSSQRATQAEKQQSAVAEDAAQGMAVKRQSRRRCDATGATSHLVRRHVAISGDSAEARLSILAQAPRSARLSKQKSARLGPRRPLAVAEPLRQYRVLMVVCPLFCGFSIIFLALRGVCNPRTPVPTEDPEDVAAKGAVVSVLVAGGFLGGLGIGPLADAQGRRAALFATTVP